MLSYLANIHREYPKRAKQKGEMKKDKNKK